MGLFSYIVTLELDIANFTISNQQPNTLSTTNSISPFLASCAWSHGFHLNWKMLFVINIEETCHLHPSPTFVTNIFILNSNNRLHWRWLLETRLSCYQKVDYGIFKLNVRNLNLNCWNCRAEKSFKTITNLNHFLQPNCPTLMKPLVWASNTNVGDGSWWHISWIFMKSM